MSDKWLDVRVDRDPHGIHAYAGKAHYVFEMAETEQASADPTQVSPIYHLDLRHIKTGVMDEGELEVKHEDEHGIETDHEHGAPGRVWAAVGAYLEQNGFR